MSALLKLSRDLLELNRRSTDSELPPAARLSAREAARRVARDLELERGAQLGDRVRIHEDTFGDVVLREGGHLLVKIPAVAASLSLTSLLVAAGEISDDDGENPYPVDARARLFKVLTGRGHFRGDPEKIVDLVVGDLVEDLLELFGLGS